jgi:hypothetical protein
LNRSLKSADGLFMQIGFKVLILFLFGSSAFSDDCLKSLANYNIGYSKASNERVLAQQDDSSYMARNLYNVKLAPFLEKNPLSEIRDFAYHLAWSIKTRRSLEDNVDEFTQILNSQIPKNYSDTVVEGHGLVKLSQFDERKNLSEMTQFLYIQAVTNSDPSRSKSLLKNLTDCPDYQVFK